MKYSVKQALSCISFSIGILLASTFPGKAQFDTLRTKTTVPTTSTLPLIYGASVISTAKNNNAVGLGSTGTSTLLSIKGSGNNSVGKAHEIAFNDTFKIFTRYAISNNVWSGWGKFVVENSSGNVGIGYTNPQSTLDIKGELGLGAIKDLPAEGAITEGRYGNYILGDKAVGQQLRLGVSNDGYTKAEIFLDNGNRPDGTIAFKTRVGNFASVTRMFINGIGDVSIGNTGGGRLSLTSAITDSSGLRFMNMNSASGVAAANGKFLSVDASGNVILTSGADSGWSNSGNSGLDPSTNFLGTTDNSDVAFRSNNIERMRLLANGNLKLGSGIDVGKTMQVHGTGYFSESLGIGTDSLNDTNYNLFVAKGIRTRKVKVDVSAWPDYVFHPNYLLPSIPEVEQYIGENNHLPGVISAKDAEQNGVDLGQTQADLLKKVEELTLYLIKHEKSIEQLKEIVELQQKELVQLRKFGSFPSTGLEVNDYTDR